MTLDEAPLAPARPLEDVEGKPIDGLSAVDERAIMADTIDRVANVVVTVVPVVLVGVAAWLSWGGALRWPDLVALAVTYLLTGLGVTVGFRRCSPTAASRRALRCGCCWAHWGRQPSRAR